MALILNAKSWQDKDGNLSPITLGTLTGAFGEERVLTLDYEFDQSLDECEIFFNPALFVEQGIVLKQSQTLPPNIAYWYKVTAATVAGAENTMNLLNSNATERNMSVTFELNADRLSFKIHLRCFLTADILKFLSNDGIDNSIRLLGNTKDAEELENLEDSIYNNSTTKGIGIHTGIKVPSFSQLCGTKGKSGKDGVQIDSYKADGEQFVIRFKPQTVIDKLEIFVNGVLTASSGTQPGNNFGAVNGFDGNNGAGYPLNSHPSPPVIPVPNRWYMGGAISFNNRLAAFEAATGVTATLGGYQQIIWVDCQAGDDIDVRVVGTQGTLWEYEVYCPQPTTTIPSKYEYSDAWINSEFIFLNEGIMTNPVFELSRNGDIETEFATFDDTDIKLQIDYNAPKTISNAKVWVIDADNTKQSLDFKKAYGYQPSNYFSVPVPTNIGGNTWETNFTIDKTKINKAGRYFIIAVYYDSANEYVASYISQSIFVTDVKFLTPTIEGTIYTLFANFFTNYLELSPLQRVCCEITLDKYTGFDAAFEGGNVQIAGETFTFIGKNNQGTFENTNRFVFSDSAGSLIIRFYLRVKEEWQNTEVDVLWNINFNVEYTTITFHQRLSITQMEQNKATPNLTEIRLYKDGIELLEEGDTACDANFLRVETIKTAESENYAQAAIWKDSNGNVYEEEEWTPISVFTQSSNAFQSDVEIQFSTVLPDNDVNHNITNLVDNGEVGMIGYPPPLPISFIRHPFQNTTKTGRNTVFWAEYDYGAGKSFAAVNGFKSDDFLFRVGTGTTPLNANDNAWAAFSDLSFAAFSALSISAGSRIMVSYVGTQPPETEQLNICGYLEMRFAETPVNPKILNLPIEKNIAAGDIMFFTGLNVNFTSATYSGGTANAFSSKRTFTEIANNEDLVTYETGLGDANSPNNSFVPHLYFQRTSTTAVTVNLKIDQIESLNVEIGNPAIPLYNIYYTNDGDGNNPFALEYDLINDVTQILGSTTKTYLDWASITNNSYVEMNWVFKFQTSGNINARRLFSITDGLNKEYAFVISQSGTLALFGLIENISGISNQIRFLTNFIDGKVYNISLVLRKKSNLGNTTSKFYLEECFLYVEGLEIAATATSNNNAAFASVAAQNCYIGNSILNSVTPTNGVRSIGEFSANVSLTKKMDLSKYKKFQLGDDSVTDDFAIKYTFENLEPSLLNPSWREIANIGTLGDTSETRLILKNSDNTLKTLY